MFFWPTPHHHHTIPHFCSFITLYYHYLLICCIILSFTCSSKLKIQVFGFTTVPHPFHSISSQSFTLSTPSRIMMHSDLCIIIWHSTFALAPLFEQSRNTIPEIRQTPSLSVYSSTITLSNASPNVPSPYSPPPSNSKTLSLLVPQPPSKSIIRILTPSSSLSHPYLPLTFTLHWALWKDQKGKENDTFCVSSWLFNTK